MPVQLRQAPLRDRDEDSALFVPPEGYETALWAAHQGLNVLILGERGQGKTSVLHQLQLDLRTHGQQVPVFVDLASADSVDVALMLIVAAANEALDRQPVWTPQLPRPNETEGDIRIRAALNELMAIDRCVFLLDNVNAEHVGFPMFGVFRDRLWEAPHSWMVAANVSDKRWFRRPPADGVWEQVVELGYTEQSANELVERRLGERPDWLAAVVENAGANPRALIRAALDLSRDADGEGDARRAWEDWHKRVAQLDRRPATLMAELAARPPVSASDPDLLRSLGWARTSLIRTLEQLEQEGLVESWSERAGSGRPRRLFTATEPGRLPTTSG